MRPKVFSAHVCISELHLMMARTRKPPMIAKKTPKHIVRSTILGKIEDAYSQMVKVHPTPMAPISGSTAAVAAAEKIYCTIYLQPMVSERALGIASAGWSAMSYSS